MVVWTINGFIGEQPLVSPNMLPPNASQGASNVRLDDGALTPYNAAQQVSSFSDYLGGYETIYLWNDTWYGWPGVVNAAPGPVATDRLYITGTPIVGTIATSAETASGATLTFESVPDTIIAGLSVNDSSNTNALQPGTIVVSTTATTVTLSLDVAATVESGDTITFGGAPQMIVNGTTYNLAVPFPAGALTATASGSGSGVTISRIYVYTYVTAFGEESEPCPASNLIDMQPGQTVTLTGFVAPPSGRNITTINIYRTETGDSGTDLYYIDQMPATDTSYADTIPDDQFAEVIPSTDYNAPVATLAGLCAMPNGMMAAYDSASPTNLYFCQPYEPHAWPEEYALETDYAIVGLAAIGTSLIVLTEGNPYLAVGTDPSTMQMVKILTNLPCINARSIVNLGPVVAYASPQGLVVVDSGGNANVATTQLFNQQDWLALSPSTMTAGQLAGRYFASYSTNDANGNPLIGTLIINIAQGTAWLLRSDIAAEAFYYDLPQGYLYYLASNGGINQFNSLAGAPLSYSWESKLNITNRDINFSCLQFDADDTLSTAQIAAINTARSDAVTANATMIESPLGSELNGEPLNVYAVNGDDLDQLPAIAPTASVSVIADGNVIATVNTPNTIQRLPGGFLSRNWEIEVSGNQRVYQVTLGTSVQEVRDTPTV